MDVLDMKNLKLNVFGRLLGAMLICSLWMSCDEEALNHTCDETEELRFPEFGDAAGVWEEIPPEVDVADAGPYLPRFEITSDGALKMGTMGCEINHYPLVLNDHNVFRRLFRVNKVELVGAKASEKMIRLDYQASDLLSSEGDIEEGYLEIRRVDPNRIEMHKRLPMGGWTGFAYERVE